MRELQRIISKYKVPLSAALLSIFALVFVAVFWNQASKPAVYTYTASTSAKSISSSISSASTVSSTTSAVANQGTRYKLFLPKHPVSDQPDANGALILSAVDRYTTRRDVKEFLIEQVI